MARVGNDAARGHGDLRSRGLGLRRIGVGPRRNALSSHLMIMRRSFRIPTSMPIAGQKIKIEVKDFNGDLYGQFLFDKKTIDVDIKVAANKKLFMETMRHEVFEACLLLSGVGWGEKYDQEQIVRCMDEIYHPAMVRLEKKIKRLNPS